MDSDEKLKLMFEQTAILHKYFLDWRYKLSAGYIAIISFLGYFILTWIQKPENFNTFTYISVSMAGIFVSILFCLINHRITKLIWKCQNKAYLIEKDLGFTDCGQFINAKTGIYGRFLEVNIKDKLDNNQESQLAKDSPALLNPLKHSGALNWMYIIVTVFYIFLLCQLKDYSDNHLKWVNSNTPSTSEVIMHGY
ncbi:MAG: hypothetical protein R2750_05400 [Bacteroidales bacterium]